jgi:hypothetical protein
MVRGVSVGVSIRDVLQQERFTVLLVRITLSLQFSSPRYGDGVIQNGDGDPACAPSHMFHPNTGGHDPPLDISPPWKKLAFGNGPLATVVPTRFPCSSTSIVLLITD